MCNFLTNYFFFVPFAFRCLRASASMSVRVSARVRVCLWIVAYRVNAASASGSEMLSAMLCTVQKLNNKPSKRKKMYIDNGNGDACWMASDTEAYSFLFSFYFTRIIYQLCKHQDVYSVVTIGHSFLAMRLTLFLIIIITFACNCISCLLRVSAM